MTEYTDAEIRDAIERGRSLAVAAVNQKQRTTADALFLLVRLAENVLKVAP